MNSISWNLIRSFLAVARSGSLSAAARLLGISQPTLSRDIRALEMQAGVNLFKRSTRGLLLTETGMELVELAREMDQSADSFGRLAQGLSLDLKGVVRISATEIVGIYLLPAAIAAFNRKHPEIIVETVITNRVSSLNKREADIALRMFRPVQSDLILRRLPDMPLGFYAHRDYLRQYGNPCMSDDLFRRYRFIGFDHDRDLIDGANALGYHLVRDDFRLRTDNLLMQINLARHACGIVVCSSGLAGQWPDMVRILEEVPIPAMEFWLVYHPDIRRNACIRRLKNHLVSWFRDDPFHSPLHVAESTASAIPD